MGVPQNDGRMFGVVVVMVSSVDLVNTKVIEVLLLSYHSWITVLKTSCPNLCFLVFFSF